MIYADDLGDEARLTFTREPPIGWTGHTGRIDSTLFADASPGADVTTFICGSNGFVESAARLALEAGGADPHRALRTDR